MKYLILCLCVILCGCLNRDDREKIKEVHMEQCIMTNALLAQTKVLNNLTKTIEDLEKEIRSIPKWK